MDCDFSDDGKYFALLTQDGKLKIWDTVANSLEQEFTPDYHLTTPCACLKFTPGLPGNSNNSSAPRKKKKRNLKPPEIVLGTKSGLLLVYSIAEAKVSSTIDSKTGQQINCIGLGQEDAVYTGGDGDLFEWDLTRKGMVSKWKVCNEKITAVLLVPDAGLLTASKGIKLWSLRPLQLLRIFAGHNSPVTGLRHAVGPYVVSTSLADRLVNCWNLSGPDGCAAVSFLAEDAVRGVALLVAGADGVTLGAAVSGGAVHVFRHTLNGRCDRPVKPATTVRVVREDGEGKARRVLPLQVMGATLVDERTVRLGHGGHVAVSFEDVQLDFGEAVQCLVRRDVQVVAARAGQTADVTKVKRPIVGNQVHYLTRDGVVGGSSSARKRGASGARKPDVPLEQRLENLHLQMAERGEGPAPRPDGVARLLLQGLHSGDEKVLQAALAVPGEEVARSSLLRLPLAALPPLAARLAALLRGKTRTAQTGALWTRCLLETHRAHLAADPGLIDVVGPALAALQARLAQREGVEGLKGRLEVALRRAQREKSDGW